MEPEQTTKHWQDSKKKLAKAKKHKPHIFQRTLKRDLEQHKDATALVPVMARAPRPVQKQDRSLSHTIKTVGNDLILDHNLHIFTFSLPR